METGDGLLEIRKLIDGTGEAALATMESGGPFVSAAGFVPAGEDFGLALLLSDLSRHTRNLRANPEVSVLVVENEPSAPVHEKGRATFTGRVRLADAGRAAALKAAFLKRFPKSEIFFTLPDFRFYELEPREIHWIGGFGRAHTYVKKGSGWQ